jgi:deoxyribonuclease-1
VVVSHGGVVKGDIARSLFYMHVEYGLPLNGMTPMLKRWHVADPPNAHERWRNKLIEGLQGVRNRFIDKPQLAASLE